MGAVCAVAGFIESNKSGTADKTAAVAILSLSRSLCGISVMGSGHPKLLVYRAPGSELSEYKRLNVRVVCSVTLGTGSKRGGRCCCCCGPGTCMGVRMVG